MRKFAKRWFGPYEVCKVTHKATYYLNELDGTQIQTPIAGKRITNFKRREDIKLNFIEHEDEDFFLKRIKMKWCELTHRCPSSEGVGVVKLRLHDIETMLKNYRNTFPIWS